MNGVGAWSKGSLSRQSDPYDPRVKAQIHAVKAEMLYRGIGPHVKLEVESYGSGIEADVKHFQTVSGLTVSGKVGPTTASYLFWTRCVRAMNSRGIPHRLVWKMIMQESAFDPAAQGYFDPADEGMGQINLPQHPGVTLAQAWDPAFAIPWMADWVLQAAAATGDWDGAVASWNVGSETASLWVEAGKPASGRVRDGIDWYTRATNYVAAVKSHRVPV